MNYSFVCYVSTQKGAEGGSDLMFRIYVRQITHN